MLVVFERDFKYGNISTYIVVLLGLGKMLFGVELIRCVGKCVLVLVFN